MAEELLPPDPSRDGWYWANLLNGPWPCIIEWRTPGTWVTPLGALQPGGAWRTGYRLASPHPIPTPEQLEALHALPDAMVRAELAASDQAEPRSIAIGRGAAERSAAMLRAALGAKPDDPPGNGLGDIRAAAMDQWGVPRAGEETAP